MRVLFGMILGIMLTFGVAYIHDARTSPIETTGTGTTMTQRNMVNWDVVSRNWNTVRLRMHDAWMDISNRMSG